MTRVTGSRAKAEKAGRLAETFAAISLQLKGYVILARRAKTGRGEVDLIARKRNVLAFIEVKMRATVSDPATILTAGQMQRIVNGATGWASARTWAQGCQWRYDLIMVTPWHWPTHLRDAWRPQNDPTLERGREGGNVRPLRSARRT
jgi:putative endonuclease